MGSGVGGGLVGTLVFLLAFFSRLSEVSDMLKVRSTHNIKEYINSLLRFFPLLTMIFIAMAVKPNMDNIIWIKYIISQLGNT